MRKRDFGIQDLQYFLSLAKDLQSIHTLRGASPPPRSLTTAIAAMRRELNLDTAGEADPNLEAASISAVNKRVADTFLGQRRGTNSTPSYSTVHDGPRALRIGSTGSISRSALDDLRRASLEDDPGIRLCMYELPLRQQIRGLHGDLLDIGLSLTPYTDGAIRCVPLWRAEMIATVPTHHLLASEKQLPLNEIARHPLVLCEPDGVGIGVDVLVRMMRSIGLLPAIAERVACRNLMTTLVVAGYGLGLSTETHFQGCDNRDVVSRPVSGWPGCPTAHLLYRPARSTATIRRYIDRAIRLSTGASRTA